MPVRTDLQKHRCAVTATKHTTWPLHDASVPYHRQYIYITFMHRILLYSVSHESLPKFGWLFIKWKSQLLGCYLNNLFQSTSCPCFLHHNFKSIYLIYLGAGLSSGSIVSDYGLDDRAIGVRSPAEAKDFSSILCVQIGSGASSFVSNGYRGPFTGGKARPGRDADHSPPSSAEVENE
jgi:hypothetical protein